MAEEAEVDVYSIPFSADTLVAHFAECIAAIDRIPHEPFLRGCTEVEKLMLSMGPALGIASSEISGKVTTMRERFTELNGKLASGALAASGTTEPAATLQFIVLEEMGRSVHSENSWTYVSAARTLLRLMWFLDFVHALINNLVQDEAAELNTCASKAYEETLAPRHGWILRNTIYAAMMTLPYRADFIATLGGGVHDAAGVTAQLVECRGVLDRIRTQLWDFYRANGIQELP